MVVGVVAMSTSVSDGQLANTPLANVLPLPVSVALVRAVHPAKVYSPTPYDEVVTEMSPVQPWKAFAPSDVTEAGMVTEERFLASRNALGNTFFTVEGMVNDLLVEVLGYFTKVVPALSYKTPPVLLKYLLAEAALTPLRETISSKTSVPMDVTAAGMETMAKEKQPWKALSPMAVTWEGMVMPSKRRHPSNSLSPMAVKPVKYCSSVKHLTRSLPRKAPSSDITAAASASLNLPSPFLSQCDRHTASTSASLKAMK